jgi:hypothetical protein
MSNQDREGDHDQSNIGGYSGYRNVDRTELASEMSRCFAHIDLFEAQMNQLQQDIKELKARAIELTARENQLEQDIKEQQTRSIELTTRENFLAQKLGEYFGNYKDLRIQQLRCDIYQLREEWEAELESRQRMSSDPKRKHSFGQFEAIKTS